MKTKFGIVLIVWTLSSCSDNIMPQETFGHNQPVNIDVFYSQLAPYGSWVNYLDYGYVWIPEVSWGFSPYFTNGHWIYTRYGWTWHSYYAWGWATFHYGRWIFDIAYGWIWVPDFVWGPAWVAWRSGPGYYGWAPLGPGVSVNIIIFGGHSIPHEHWCFVKERDLYDSHIDQHRVDRSQNVSMIDRSSVVRNVREERNEQYMSGPDRDEIQRVTQREINQVEIMERNRPGAEKLRNNQLEIFRPTISSDLDHTSRTPQNVIRLDEINKRSDGEAHRKQGQLKVPAYPSIQERKPQELKIQIKPPVRENKTGPGKRISPSKKNTGPRKRDN